MICFQPNHVRKKSKKIEANNSRKKVSILLNQFNMSIQTRPSAKSGKKGKQTYQFDLQLHEALVRTYIAPGQMERMTSKYGKKVKLELHPPASGPCCGHAHEHKCEHSTSPKFWTLRATGKHRQTMKQLAKDMTERHENIVRILTNITAPGVSSSPRKN